MKALTLWQPWASAIAYGMKRHETRSWYTSYRGPLAIHAAKRRPTREDLEMLAEWPLPIGGHLPLGVVVATCNLVDVIRCTDKNCEGLSKRESAFGNFSPGRYAWALLDVRPVVPPIPAVGGRSFWEWNP